MKKVVPPSPLIPSLPRSPLQGGMALVIVLGMLVLVTILVIAFVTSVATELRSARSYSSGYGARMLADSAVNIVISQIQDATSDPALAWASQPGMIRTWDDAGRAAAAYKLYSSGQLRVNGAFNPVQNQNSEVPGNWASLPNLYTDLNRPVTVSGTRHYPIIDPSALAVNVSGGASLDGSSTPIEGAFINTANAATEVTPGQTNPVPMPVQWMYMLEDGTVASMDPSTMKVSGATVSNPIVGRVAFWTDDESSKVNINTASEGTFWDRPRTHGRPITGSFPNATSASYEPRLGINMPAQNEFQRIPGHPAMTSLSAVFGRVAGETVEQYNQRIYDIIPRINFRDQNGNPTGSLSGTRNVNQTTSPIVPDTDRLFASVDEFLFGVANAPRQLNRTGDGVELTEQDIQKTRFFLTANSRAPEVNLFNKPRITLWPLQIDPNPGNGARTRNAKDRLIAFASTVGHQPYYFQRYNVYTSANQTPIPSSQSPRMDWDLIPRNQELYAYLQAMTSRPIPGLGGSLLAKYPDTRDQILTQMWDYVRSGVNTFSTESPTNTAQTPHYFYTPFTPSGFVTGQSQIVPLALPNGTKGFGRFSTITEAGLIFYVQDQLAISGTIPPGGTMQWGTGNNRRVETYPDGRVLDNYIIENIPTGDPLVRITGDGYTLSSEEAPSVNVGAVLMLRPFNPTPGPPPWSGHYQFVVRGLNGLSVNNASMGFPALAVNKVSSRDTQANATALTGMETYFLAPPTQSGHYTSPKVLGPTDPDDPDPQFYPFYASFEVTPVGDTFEFSGGDIVIEIHAGSASTLDQNSLVQTIHMTFPPSTLPMPSLGRRSYSSNNNETTITLSNRLANHFTEFDNRIRHQRNPGANSGSGRYGVAEFGQHGPMPLIIGQDGSPFLGDTVRSVEARYGGVAGGDYRLFAGLKEVPSSFFHGHGMTDPVTSTRRYSDSVASSRLVHFLSMHGLPTDDTSNSNGYYAGAGRSNDLRGRLVAGITYPDPNRGGQSRNRRVPIVPRGLTEARMANGELGDWDTGIGQHPDGPFINPADQATAQRGSGNNAIYYSMGQQVTGAGIVEVGGASFSPSRQISSAIAFGSLPTGIDPNNRENSRPWQTLLFARNPLAGDNHPGFGTPLAAPPYSTAPDHAFLDLFTMPIVEPYAISEPFSTAGKVNINYQIVPFTYLTRSTAVRAVMKSTKMMAIPTTSGMTYKLANNPDADYRFTINPDEQQGTLAGFEARFNSGDIFRSASEICDIFLVPLDRADGSPAPNNPTYGTMSSWWDDYLLTGDNMREQPYGHLYPRLTTKSNTFTVHVVGQSLQKATGSPADEFVDGRDQVSGEFRGSFIIERFLDPNSDSLVRPDGSPTDELDPNAMVGPYKFRVISSKRFAP